MELTLANGQHLTFREATQKDAELITSFIMRMAEYEKCLDVCSASVESTQRFILDEGYAKVEFAVLEGREVGFMLYYPKYSTFQAKPCLHLEELFVLEEVRSLGIGQCMLEYLAAQFYEKGYGRIEWWCLDWNTPARTFYAKMGAKDQTEWVVYFMNNEELKEKYERIKACGL